MDAALVGERLRIAREARQEDLAALAQRIGVRESHLRAIEEGRLNALPPGVYGRAALRSFATACGCDAAEILAVCESLLPALEDPINALARSRGLRPRRPDADRADHAIPDAPIHAVRSPHGAGARLGAAGLDGIVILGLLMLVVGVAAGALRVSISALDDCAGAFGVMGALLAASYFVCFAGVGGVTPGQRVFGVPRERSDAIPLTPRLIAARAVRAAAPDVLTLQQCGGELARMLESLRHRQRA